MKTLKFIVNSTIDLELYVEFNNLEYEFNKNTLEISNLNEFPNQIIFTGKVKNKRKFNYFFYLHKRNSSGLFQWSKEINTINSKIFLPDKYKKDKLLLTIDIYSICIQNYYKIDEYYLSIKNIKIDKKIYNNIYYCSNLNKTTKIIDAFLLTIKNFMWLLFGLYLCIDVYKARFYANSIFNGDMIWIDIIIIICCFISYSIFSVIRLTKYHNEIKKQLCTSKDKDNSLNRK